MRLYAEQGPSPDPRVVAFSCPRLGRPSTPAVWDVVCARLVAIVGAFRPEVVHFASAGMAVYHDVVPSDIPTVATVHGNDLTAPWQEVPVGDAAERIRAGLGRCARLITLTRYTAQLVEARLPDAVIDVIPPGCDLTRYRPLPIDRQRFLGSIGVPSDVPVLLTLSRFAARKGHLTVLAALERLDRAVHWVIAGGHGNAMYRVQAALSRSRVHEQITILGQVPDDMVPLLYNACDAFVLTPEPIERDGRLDSEGFGLVFHEAGACEKPVIGADAAGCREAVIHDRTGLLVPPGDVAALAAALDRLLSDASLRARLGAGGLAHVRGGAGWASVAERMGTLFAQLACSAAP